MRFARANIWTSFSRLASVMYVLVACAPPAATSQQNASECEVTKLVEVFSAPLKYNGKIFCGRVFMARVGRSVRFYTDAQQARNSTYDIALVATPDIPKELKAMNGDGFVVLHGRLEVDKGCVTGVESDGSGDIVKCTPERIPIFISITFAAVEPVAVPGSI